MSSKVLRLTEVCDRTGLSKSLIYKKMQEFDFPQSIALGARAVGWLEEEIEQWIHSRVSKSRQV